MNTKSPSNSPTYSTSDIKLQAFLRLMIPDSFIDINRDNPRKVSFLFKTSDQLKELVTGYISRKKYLISPLSLADNIDQGKGMVYGDY